MSRNTQLSQQLTSKKAILGIIVTFNPDSEHFNLFLNKLASQFSNILIVDNNSTEQDNLFVWSQAISPSCKIHVIKNQKNIGLASAQNQGAQYALDNSFEAFCIFDQDSDINMNYLDIMFLDYNSLCANGISVGSIGPCIVDRSSHLVYPIAIYKGYFLNRYKLMANEIAECSYIIASGSLISVNTIKNVGFFMDKLFINYIDVEWCFRSSSKGYKIFITNNTQLTQDVGIYRKMFFGRAIPVHNPIRRYYAARNSVLMLFLPHVSIGYKIREFIFNPLRLIFDCLVAGNTLIRIKLFLKGIYNGIRQK